MYFIHYIFIRTGREKNTHQFLSFCAVVFHIIFFLFLSFLLVCYIFFWCLFCFCVLCALRIENETGYDIFSVRYFTHTSVTYSRPTPATSAACVHISVLSQRFFSNFILATFHIVYALYSLGVSVFDLLFGLSFKHLLYFITA